MKTIYKKIIGIESQGEINNSFCPTKNFDITTFNKENEKTINKSFDLMYEIGKNEGMRAGLNKGRKEAYLSSILIFAAIYFLNNLHQYLT